MKFQGSYRKVQKYHMFVLALFLAMGMFLVLNAQPSYAITTAWHL
jgi:hypothetical protein